VNPDCGEAVLLQVASMPSNYSLHEDRKQKVRRPWRKASSLYPHIHVPPATAGSRVQTIHGPLVSYEAYPQFISAVFYIMYKDNNLTQHKKEVKEKSRPRHILDVQFFLAYYPLPPPGHAQFFSF
jgi:hypothetical protein